ncbi:TPA: helix-turn-helix domain-containing protein [Serratia marcescens]|uniref:Helix-turn-helix domain-containing protein n=6 Tax=Serratia TaxID=613 RepID=A0AB35YYK5_SERMA|nr:MULTISPECIES: helix-turn-helix domain-containing protein [Serratia]MCT2272499.1 helix-turn-helix domain-containing protein [Serratia ureilytica]MDM1818259.1 helix-turn-helix domain-containing protein [Serratia ureilytica]MDM1842644.1 helix-turn-helix domain-containing protein [Serratia ureilytica]MDP8755009.1 helix-turn-helix domain-containing protein [Serratia marcescens]MDP8759670.1 helix-turn-helix domain-containing protein [Serratia marcescens]
MDIFERIWECHSSKESKPDSFWFRKKRDAFNNKNSKMTGFTMDCSNKFRRNILDEIIAIIEKAIDTQSHVSIRALSIKSGYSIGHLQRMFYLYEGMKIGTYIRKRRLSRATLLLKCTDMKIYEIALLSGFSSQQSFSRAFSNQFGCPPRTFRTLRDWPFLNYQPIIGFDKEPFPSSIVYLNLHEYYENKRIVQLLSPVISRGQMKVNVKNPITCSLYNASAKYIAIRRNEKKMSENEFILSLYEGVLASLDIFITQSVIFKIHDHCPGEKENVSMWYFIPIK